MLILHSVVIRTNRLRGLVVAACLLLKRNNVRVQTVHRNLIVAVIIRERKSVFDHFFAWTHFGEGKSASSRCEYGKLLELKAIFVRILHIFTNISLNLISSCHPSNFCESLLLRRQSIWVVL